MVLARYKHFESIPAKASEWEVTLRSADKLAAVLQERQSDAYLFRDLATLRTNADVFDKVDDLRWPGPTPAFETMCGRLESPQLLERAVAVAKKRT